MDALLLLDLGMSNHGVTDTVLIIDIKPRMERVSALQGQINRYEEIAKKMKIYRCRIKVIITMDNSDKYDEMLYNQNIYVIYVPRDVIHNDKPLPRSSYKRRDRIKHVVDIKV